MTETNIFADLAAEGEDIDQLVAELHPSAWTTQTPAPGWTIAHQIAHLSAIFHMAGLAADDGAAFEKMVSQLSDDFDANVNAAMAPYLAEPVPELLARWRDEREYAQKSLEAVPEGQPVPWLVRPLTAEILAAAGMMELFGHGQDIADALGVRRTVTDRIGHIVLFSVLTWDFGYQARDLPTPDIQLRFELTAPSGTVWEFGPDDSTERISGSAADFCLLVTRRRHRDDLDLKAQGDEANRWLDLAQAYRGPAGEGRKPGQFSAAA